MSEYYIIAADEHNIYNLFHLPKEALNNSLNISNLVSKSPEKFASHPKDLAELLILLVGADLRLKEITIVSLPFAVIKSSGGVSHMLRPLDSAELNEFAKHYSNRTAELLGRGFGSG